MGGTVLGDFQAPAGAKENGVALDSFAALRLLPTSPHPTAYAVYVFRGASGSRSMVLPASRRQVFRSPIVSFCRQDAGSTLNRYYAVGYRLPPLRGWETAQELRCAHERGSSGNLLAEKGSNVYE